MHKTFFILFVLLSLIGCGSSDSDVIPASSFKWDTNGGGDLHFLGYVKSDGKRWIQVTKYNFQHADIEFSVLSSDGSPFSAFNRIISNQEGSIKTYLPNAATPTGTWTEIEVKIGEKSKDYQYVDLDTELRSLYYFVVSKIPISN